MHGGCPCMMLPLANQSKCPHTPHSGEPGKTNGGKCFTFASLLHILVVPSAFNISKHSTKVMGMLHPRRLWQPIGGCTCSNSTMTDCCIGICDGSPVSTVSSVPRHALCLPLSLIAWTRANWCGHSTCFASPRSWTSCIAHAWCAHWL